MPEKLLAFFPELARCHAVFLFEHPVKIGKIFKTGFCRNIQNGGVGSCQQTRGDCQAVVPQIVHESSVLRLLPVVKFRQRLSKIKKN